MKPELRAAPAAVRPASGRRERRPPTGNGPSSLRLFYALKVPPEIAAPLAEAQRGLKGNWRAVRPEQLHVTLSYLPTVAPDRVEELRRLGQRLVRDRPPLALRLRGTGYFPNEGSPRVWFVKVEADGLTELAEELRAAVRALGVETDDLPFKAHITLARKKGPAPRVPPLLFETGWTAPSLTLYRSVLRKTGPIYEVQSTFRFQRPTAPPGPSAPTPSETDPAPGAQEPA
ncbi:2'-5' RNA ligase [Deinococcus reticulitermitis]|uniref:RNA 2',3'-cyclic phosphodiesterase n=1 Tax=Deinococcus reticulitermitis TaxID=856736 RepID=A0A1H7A7E4_9DEIO|nr:RNA 2',3'-cyclic phosphodiesterase [Deinococcus reticulitermitis]SEJ57790.1 2'-5' RNA ligase [Deinococcus reticulitermitis]